MKPNFGNNITTWTEASPIEYINKHKELCPFLLINASLDLGLEIGAKNFCNKLNSHGFSVKHEFVPLTAHGSVTR